MKNIKKLFITAALLALPLGVFSAEIIAEIAPGGNPETIGTPYGLTLLDVTDNGPFALYSVPKGQDPEIVEAAFEAEPRVV